MAKRFLATFSAKSIFSSSNHEKDKSKTTSRRRFRSLGNVSSASVASINLRNPVIIKTSSFYIAVLVFFITLTAGAANVELVASLDTNGQDNSGRYALTCITVADGYPNNERIPAGTRTAVGAAEIGNRKQEEE